MLYRYRFEHGMWLSGMSMTMKCGPPSSLFISRANTVGKNFATVHTFSVWEGERNGNERKEKNNFKIFFESLIKGMKVHFFI